MQKVILIKYGEIALKGKNRHIFESSLVKNICLAFGSGVIVLEKQRGRIYLRLTEKGFWYYQELLSRVFGIIGFAEAFRLPLDSNISEIVEIIISCIRKLKNQSLTFCIDSRRSFKNFHLDSLEINKLIGKKVLQCFPSFKVDLNCPELTIFIEIRKEGVFGYTNFDYMKGSGGLPVGVGGRGLLLLSGGIDSPVAGWALLKRGMLIDAVYFHSFPYTGEKAKQKVIDLARVLTRWKLRAVNLYIPYFTQVQELVNKRCPESTWTIIHRRFMIRICEKLAVPSYQALITGENLGQVSSQTIENIAVINKVTRLPILRPLISLDKQDIINLAEQINTFQISKRPYPDCCSLFAPKRPETKAKEEEILEAEKLLPIESLIAQALEKMEVVQVTSDKLTF